MTDRTLPAADWERLAGTPLAPVWHILRAGTDRVIVVEEADQIIGCWTLIPVYHGEGIWVHPDHQQRAAVARRLLRAMRAAAQEQGIRAIVTSAFTPEIAAYAERLGAIELPGRHFAMPVEG